jgi:hypothetical protein
MLTTAQLETLDAVTADEKTLVASHPEARRRRRTERISLCLTKFMNSPDTNSVAIFRKLN